MEGEEEMVMMLDFRNKSEETALVVDGRDQVCQRTKTTAQSRASFCSWWQRVVLRGAGWFAVGTI